MSDLLFKIILWDATQRIRQSIFSRKKTVIQISLQSFSLSLLLLPLAVIFRDSITSLVRRLMNKVTNNADAV